MISAFSPLANRFLCISIKRFFLLMLCLLSTALYAEEPTPKELEAVEIKEHIGDKIPLDLSFVDDHGKTVELSQYFKKDKPVILSLVYYNCPMLCNLVLNGLLSAVKESKWVPGDAYEIVSVSISPRETSEVAAAKKANYMEQLSLNQPEMKDAKNGWHFLTGQEENIQKLAKSVGFGYRYDPSSQDYAHGAVLFILTQEGVLKRYLYGITFEGEQLRLALTETGEGAVGSVIDQILLRCFKYEPSHQKYKFYIWGAMRVGGLITILLITILLTILWGQDRRNKSIVSQS
jgi:protein SCO1/2